MAKHRASSTPPQPAFYAVVLPGLEEITAEELRQDFGAEVKKTSKGIVVFRPPEIDRSLLRLRTAEDVFLLAWGTDQLTYRAKDLKEITRWTDRDVNWSNLLRIHHSIRPKPSGKPTYRLVAQMTGKHAYRRVDALKALAKGMADKLPASWKHAEENAALEIWLTIHGRTAVCGVRLSDRTMRHRKYKTEHMPASLRPTVAAAMVRLAAARPGQHVLDPLCGAGTILAEQLAVRRSASPHQVEILGGDIELEALRNSRANLHKFPDIPLFQWDATELPLANDCVDCIISNPPFGKQLGKREEIGHFYQNVVNEMDRVLRPGGVVVLLVSDFPALQQAAKRMAWKQKRTLEVRVLGQWATVSVWRKP